MSARNRFAPLLTAAIAVVLVAACTSPAASPSLEPASAAPSLVPSAEAPPESADAAASEPVSAGDATVLVGDSDLGSVLTDEAGITIYYFANDSEDTSTCFDECMLNWPPVPVVGGAATAGEGVTAQLGSIEREGSGAPQLTVNGFPAYYYLGDGDVPGSTEGHGVGGVWFAFGPDGTPIGG